MPITAIEYNYVLLQFPRFCSKHIMHFRVSAPNLYTEALTPVWWTWEVGAWEVTSFRWGHEIWAPVTGSTPLESKSPTKEPSSCDLLAMRARSPSASGVRDAAAGAVSPIADDPQLCPLPPPQSLFLPVHGCQPECQLLQLILYFPSSLYCKIQIFFLLHVVVFYILFVWKVL